MEESLKAAVSQMLKSIRCGASVWTTFRFISNVLYAACWVVALPVELLLNRRIGRRYSGILPLFVGVVIMVQYLNFASSAVATANKTQWVGPILEASGAARIALLVVLIALLGHRLSNWWRFRTDDQVHSFSPGIPLWMHPPRALAALLPRPRTAASSGAPETIPPAADPTFGLRSMDVGVVSTALLQGVRAELNGILHAWRSGAVPTGSIVWIATTVVHPIALSVFGTFVLRRIDLGLASYLAIAALAIFVKARIQKAVVVESVYDLFDARIEQEFTRALSDPVRINQVEAKGFTVPGLARTLADVSAAGARPGVLASDLQALMAPEVKVGQAAAETRPGE